MLISMIDDDTKKKLLHNNYRAVQVIQCLCVRLATKMSMAWEKPAIYASINCWLNRACVLLDVKIIITVALFPLYLSPPSLTPENV